MRLVYSPVNMAWAFVFGDALLRLDGEALLFPTKQEAEEAARRKGLSVSSDGEVKAGAPWGKV